MLVPHDIDWVKDRVRWYWEHKLAKPRKSTDPTTTIAEPEKKESPGSTAGAGVAATAKEAPIAV